MIAINLSNIYNNFLYNHVNICSVVVFQLLNTRNKTSKNIYFYYKYHCNVLNLTIKIFSKKEDMILHVFTYKFY